MIVRPATEICRNYEEIADLCRRSGEPVFLAESDGSGLVLMDAAAFRRREEELRLREELLAVEKGLLCGETGYTPEQTAAAMEDAVREATRDR